MCCLEKTKHHSASEGRLVNPTKKLPQTGVLRIKRSLILKNENLAMRRAKCPSVKSDLRFYASRNGCPAQKPLGFTPLTTLSSEKVNPDSKNNMFIRLVAALRFCHSSSREGRG